MTRAEIDARLAAMTTPKQVADFIAQRKATQYPSDAELWAMRGRMWQLRREQQKAK